MTTQLEGGHTDSVLCVGNTYDGRLLSGGDDGKLCLWSLDGASTPQQITVSEDEDGVTSAVCSRLRPFELYAACGEKVLIYDMRQLNQPVFTFTQNEEEVNQLALHEKEDYLAACDDSGHIKIFNLQDRRVYKTLRKHTNICSSVAFRPRRPWDLLSAGLDCMLIQWDFSRSKNVCNIKVSELGTMDCDAQDQNIVTPPFIHSLAVSPTGNFVACGTENAQVKLFNGRKRSLEYLSTLYGHSCGVSQVYFSSDSTLVTGGNDGRVLLWSLDKFSIGSDGAMANGHHMVNGYHGGAMVNGHHDGAMVNGHHGGAMVNGHHNGAMVNGDENGADLVNGDVVHNAIIGQQISPTYNINHDAKVNWITSSTTPQGSSVLVIADNTSTISIYPIPE